MPISRFRTVSRPMLTAMTRPTVSISTVACEPRAIAMCRAALNSEPISVAALRTLTLSRRSPAHGMAMAESMLRTQIVTVSSMMVNACRTYPSVGLTG
jgi:hypothetical protein